MAPGYSKPLYLLAFDHRGSFEHDLFGAPHPVPDEVRARITDAKEVIYEGFVEAARRGVPRDAAGILVDEQYGASVAREAHSAGDVLAMPVEKSGQAEFDFQYGDEFGRHIDEFGPTFAKALVRYNPEGDGELNRLETRSGSPVSARGCNGRDRHFLFELPDPADGRRSSAGWRGSAAVRPRDPPGPGGAGHPRTAGRRGGARHLEDRGPRLGGGLRAGGGGGAPRRQGPGLLHRARARRA